MRIEDKVVILTGAAGGIGRALAARFRKEGARAIVACDRDASGLDAVARETGAVAAACDVTDYEAVRRVVADYFRRKAADYDRWIRAMQRLREKFPQG